MKSYAPVSLLFFLVTAGCSLQLHGQVTGTVVDTLEHAVPFCNVILVNAADSSIVTGTTSDDSGHFSLEKKSAGDFRIRIKYTGYKEYYSASFPLTDEHPSFNAGTIMLEPDATVMKDFVVVADKPFMEQQVDRTVYNIENSVLSTGSNALDLLRKLPGVIVDNNDNIQVRGKSGVQVMIDGKMSLLSGTDIAAYLKTIDAGQIRKIEVITNPSAKYDAAGQAIINIVLKKNQELGLNGQATLSHSQGFYGDTYGNAFLNYRLKKWNFFGSYNQGVRGFSNETKRITIFDRGTATEETFENNQRFVNHSLWENPRMSIDFMPDKKQTLSITGEYETSDNRQHRTYSTMIYTPVAAADSSLFTDGEQTNFSIWRSCNINYQYKIDTTGKELDAGASYGSLLNRTSRDNITDYYNSAGTFSQAPTEQKLLFPSDIRIVAGQADYVQPSEKKGKIETGIKNSIVSIDNNAGYWNVINATDINDTMLSNHFKYKEMISAAYFNYSFRLNKKLDIQAGLRGEETSSNGNLLTTGIDFSRNYFDLFPSAFLNWKIDSTHTINFSWTRRIDRPDYGELNPFRFYTNPYNYFTGNPYLRPEISNDYEISHVFRDMFSISVGYLHMKDVFTLVPHLVDSTHVFYNRNENFSTYDSWNVLGAVSTPLTRWLTTVTSVNLFYDDYSAPYGNMIFRNKGFTWIINTLNVITLGRNCSAEISCMYRSVNREAFWVDEPLINLNIGIRQKFAQQRGMIALNATDILNQSFLNATASYADVYDAETGTYDNRRLYLSVSWKFGQSRYQRDEQQKSGEDVIERAK